MFYSCKDRKHRHKEERNHRDLCNPIAPKTGSLSLYLQAPDGSSLNSQNYAAPLIGKEQRTLKLSLEIDHFAEQLVGGGDGLGVCLESPLILNEVYEFQREIHRGSL